MGLMDTPTLDKQDGIIAFLLAFFLGGLGTLIFGFMKDDGQTKKQGIIYLLLTLVFGLGYLLALIWGILALVRAK